jgi:hypothetical protein
MIEKVNWHAQILFIDYMICQKTPERMIKIKDEGYSIGYNPRVEKYQAKYEKIHTKLNISLAVSLNDKLNNIQNNLNDLKKIIEKKS